jgi:PAS domain S-box-containing protein
MMDSKWPTAPLASAAPSPGPGPNEAFAAILDAVPGSWFFTRRDGSFAYVNQGACDSLGYSRDQLIAARIFDIDPMMNPELWQQLWSGNRPSAKLTLRTVHRRRNGADFPVEVRASRLVLDGEDLAVSYAVDITASERTREALAKAEAELERLLTHLPDLVFRLRRTPTIAWLFASPSSNSLLGYHPDELVGGTVDLARLIHPHDIDAFLELDRAEQGLSHRIRFLHRDGRVVWMGVKATVIPGPRPGELVLEGVARDVTKRHQAELQGRRLLAGIEQSTEAFVITDVQGRLEYVNPAFERSTGLASQDVVGQPWAELEVREDDALPAELLRVLSEEVPWSGRVKSVRHDGEGYYEDVTLSPFRDAHGAFAGLVAVKRDVTEQLKLEAQLIQAQKMDAVGQLAGGIAHDFNNVLCIALGNIHLMQRRSPSPRYSQMLDDAQFALERASRLVKQLLTFSRKGNVETHAVALEKVLQGSHGMLSRLLGEHIHLDFQCDAAQPLVLVGNGPQLEQVIVNLCVNARDAMKDGGSLRLTLERVARDELPETADIGGARQFARLTVSDTGHGMPPEVRDRVFEPFFTTKPPGKGTGLGLATAYAIVGQHRGHMDVHSQPGEGTTFRIHLPLSDAEPPTPHASQAPSTVHGEGRWVLVAEDEPAVRKLLSCYFEEVGFQVLSVDNGRAANAVLAERGSDFALVVLDAVMPELGGRAVLQSMRAQDLQVPVLFVTGYDNESLADIIDAPNVATLSKPFLPEKLTRLAARLLHLDDSGD